MDSQERKKQRRKRTLLKLLGLLAVAAIVAAIGLWNNFTPFRRYLPAYPIGEIGEGEVRIHFLDVGQGDCEIVELGGGTALIIDAGDGSWEHNSHILRYLKGLRTRSVLLAVTHADTDHCGGAAAILEDQNTETVFLPVLPASMKAYSDIGKRAEERGAEVKTLSRYSTIERGGAYAVCLSPYSVDETDTNDSSAVIFFSYAGVNVLFGGDVSATREERLLNEQKLSEQLGEHLFDSGGHAVRLEETDILKVSHHGSGGSSSLAWLELLKPETAVISCGQGNSYGHPADGALTRLAAIGAEIYRTDELGDVMITISPDGTYRTEYHRY